MNNYLSNLTVIVVTYKTNFDILKNCLKSIDPKVKTLIIENSNELNCHQEIKNQFSNDDLLICFFDKPKNDISPWWSARRGGNRLIVESGLRCGPLLPIKHANT